MDAPAYRLKGLDLDGGWHVEERVEPASKGTGGNFSCGYKVIRKDGALGFLKALDFSIALKTKDPVSALKPLLDAYEFERSLLNECRACHMDRIVLALADGSVVVDPSSPIGVVQYLIFESADCDLRVGLHLLGDLEIAWKLRSLHHIATGLNQLHVREVAHQDLKPSNILVFDGKVSKIADLGCASVRGKGGPRDSHACAGDLAYAPIEALYGYLHPEWIVRRHGCDLWHLGSMVVFLFTGSTMTSLILSEIPSSINPEHWSGTFDDALPYVVDAFGRVIETLGRHVTNEGLRRDLQLIVRQLCNPEVNRRGHPVNLGRPGNSLIVVSRVPKATGTPAMKSGLRAELDRRSPKR